MTRFSARLAAAVAAVSLGTAGSLVTPVLVTHAIAAPPTQIVDVADLASCCGDPQPDATGAVAFGTVSKAGGAEADIFASQITIPSASPGLAATAPPDIRIVLSRGGQDYAECFLVQTKSSGGANPQIFQVAIVKATARAFSTIKQLAGQCDIDLSTDGIQAGIPAVEPDDVATVTSVSGSVRTDFLSGTFVLQQTTPLE
jgi:hypothetical protein